MSNYNIGLSGLRSNSEAIDTISTNIANASTVGYKMGEFVFQDQFYRAINPLDPARAGMGVAKQNIRRIFTQGAVQSSANTLDMAITGAMGMFRLASNTASDEIFYTRNGQFAVSVQTDPSYPYPETRNYIVNENGHFLTGYSGNGTKLSTEPTGLLTMPPPLKNPEATTDSQVYVNLDARDTVFLASSPDFDKDDANTYSYKTSQTVYSGTEAGGAHTLTLFYRRVTDEAKTITFSKATGFFSLDQTSVADPASTDAAIVLGSQVSRSFERLTPDGADVHAYRITLQDGTRLTMTSTDEWDSYSDLLTNGGATATFSALVTQYEVYAALNGQMYNDGQRVNHDNDVATPVVEARYSDSALNGITEDISSGTVMPVAVMQFWGGKNIDGIALDAVKFEPTFRTKVSLNAFTQTDGTGRDLFTFDLDLTNTNNFSSPFSVYESSQNGFGVSYLNSVVIGSDGKIVGTYGDGRQYLAGQLVLVHFSATNGLVPVGNNEYVASYLSGREVDEGVIRGVPGERGLGGIRASAVEASNVDLANELVKLLIQQRMYSANSQSIRAFDDTLTTTIRMTGG